MTIDLLSKFRLSIPPFGRSSAKRNVALACDFGKSNVLFLEIERTGDSATVTRFLKAVRPADEASLPDFLRQLFHSGNFASRRVRISVKGQGVIVRFVQFPEMKIDELKSAIVYESEKYIPFKYSEVSVDFHVLNNKVPLATGGTGMEVLLVAMKRDELGGLLQIFQKAGLEVELIDIDALASFNALEFFHPEAVNSHVAVLDIGTDLSTLTVVREGRPSFIRDVSYGSADILKLLRRKLGLSDDNIREQFQNHQPLAPEVLEMLQEGLSNLVGDLKVSMDYSRDQSQSSETIKTLFVGGGGEYHGINIDTLSRDLGIPTRGMDIFSKLKLAPGVDEDQIKKSQGLLPVALGLGLRNL